MILALVLSLVIVVGKKNKQKKAKKKKGFKNDSRRSNPRGAEEENG